MSRKLTVGSLFSGIGGIDLGLERAGMETRWFSEIDPYASRVLAKHWPTAPNHGDITQIDFRAVEPVDVLAGGFPCKGTSRLGLRNGLAHPESKLWEDYVRAIGDLRPRYVFVENVADLHYRGLDRVLGDLAALGYDAEGDCIPAPAVGADHIRDRYWLVAYPEGIPRSVFPPSLNRRDSTQRRAELSAGGRDRLAPSRSRWTVPTPWLVGDPNGIPARVDRIRALGNAVVPQIPELIGGWIIEHARATGYVESTALPPRKASLPPEEP